MTDLRAEWRTRPILTATVRGLPIQQGSITNLGKGRPAVHSNAKTLKPWRIQVQGELEECASKMDSAQFPLIGPICVQLVFTMPKPKSAPKRRRTWPTTRPDIDKLARAVLDASTFAGMFGDDAQVVRLWADETYPGEHPDALEVPGVVIQIGQIVDDETPAPTIVDSTPPATAAQIANDYNATLGVAAPDLPSADVDEIPW